MAGGQAGVLQEIMQLHGSILQAEACQILSLAKNPRWSRVWQKCIGSKVIAKTKYFRKIEPKMADFLCILVRNLKWTALYQFYSDLPQIFCCDFSCISTCNPSLRIKSSIFSSFDTPYCTVHGSTKYQGWSGHGPYGG